MRPEDLVLLATAVCPDCWRSYDALELAELAPTGETDGDMVAHACPCGGAVYDVPDAVVALPAAEYERLIGRDHRWHTRRVQARPTVREWAQAIAAAFLAFPVVGGSVAYALSDAVMGAFAGLLASGVGLAVWGTREGERLSR